MERLSNAKMETISAGSKSSECIGGIAGGGLIGIELGGLWGGIIGGVIGGLLSCFN